MSKNGDNFKPGNSSKFHRRLTWLFLFICLLAKLPALPMLLSSPFISLISSSCGVGNAFNAVLIEFLEEHWRTYIWNWNTTSKSTILFIYWLYTVPEGETSKSWPLKYTRLFRFWPLLFCINFSTITSLWVVNMTLSLENISQCTSTSTVWFVFVKCSYIKYFRIPSKSCQIFYTFLPILYLNHLPGNWKYMWQDVVFIFFFRWCLTLLP